MGNTLEYHEGRIEVAQKIVKICDKWLYDGEHSEKLLIEIAHLCKEIEHNSYVEQEKILADMAEHEPVNRLKGASEHE